VDRLVTHEFAVDSSKPYGSPEKRDGLSIITVCQLQYGLERRAQKFPHLRAREQSLLAAMLAPFQVFPLDYSTVDVYGNVRWALERSGRGIAALNTFIAAQALAFGATLVTSNVKEFSRVPGLQVQDWR
jgi:tRNA(fMet)-specific endonuclease VapC